MVPCPAQCRPRRFQWRLLSPWPIPLLPLHPWPRPLPLLLRLTLIIDSEETRVADPVLKAWVEPFAPWPNKGEDPLPKTFIDNLALALDCLTHVIPRSKIKKLKPYTVSSLNKKHICEMALSTCSRHLFSFFFCTKV